MSINMPPPWVVQGYGVPTVCARHGQQVAQGRPVSVRAYPGWTWAMLLLGLLPFFIARAATRKTLRIPAWPLCDRCVRRRGVMIGVVGAGILLGVASIVLPLVAIDQFAPLLILVGLVVLASALILTQWATWASVAGVRTTEHLAWLTIDRPHPAFAAGFAPYAAHLQPGQAHLQSGQAQQRGPRPSVAWPVALVLGIVAMICGGMSLVTGVTCGDATMRPGDICETERDGRVTETTYAQERMSNIVFQGAGVAGAVVFVVSILRLRKPKRIGATR